MFAGRNKASLTYVGRGPCSREEFTLPTQGYHMLYYSTGTVLGFADRVVNQADEAPDSLSDVFIAGHR